MNERQIKDRYGDDAETVIDRMADDYVQNRRDMYDTGKVVIGARWEPKPPVPDADADAVQSALLGAPEDLGELILRCARLFFGFLAVCIFAGMLYAIITKSPNKPVPDCGSCRIYKEKTK